MSSPTETIPVSDRTAIGAIPCQSGCIPAPDNYRRGHGWQSPSEIPTPIDARATRRAESDWDRSGKQN